MTGRRRVLVVDDDPDVTAALRRFLEVNGFEARAAADAAGGLEEVKRSRPDAALVDFSLGDVDGITLLRSIKAIDPTLPVIVLTGHGSIDLAVEAIKEGAEQFLTKPVEMPSLLVMIERAIESQRMRQVSMARKSIRARRSVDPFFGESEAIRQLADRAGRVVGSSVPLLIQGETGTGKGVLARWLHDNGPRRDEAFVDLNCAGLSRDLLETELFGHEKGAFTGAVSAKEGLLEMADRGTVFLDEIGEVDAQVQPKLLKVLDELRFRRLGDVRDRQVDVRLIAATHRDLEGLVGDGRFREDLFYRINAVPLVIPPLRERGRDVVLLAQRLLRTIAAEVGRPGLRLSPGAEAALEALPWPGNVRQLRNVLEHAAFMSERDVLEPEDVGGGALERSNARPAPSTGATTLAEAERRHIEATLEAQEWNVRTSAAALGLSRTALYDRIKKHGIRLPGAGPAARGPR